MKDKETEVVETSKIEIAQKDKGKSHEIYLDGYYSIRLGLNGDLENDVALLTEFFKDRFKGKYDSTDIQEVIVEYINLFNARGLNGAEILADRISMVSRKGSSSKKNISYLIGCLRNNLEYGISATGSHVEKRLLRAFEEKYRYTLSANGRDRLLGLATKNNTADIVLTIIENEINVEDMLIDQFEILFNKDWEET